MKTFITILFMAIGSMAYSQSATLYVDAWGDTTQYHVFKEDGTLDYKIEYFGETRKLTGYHTNGNICAIGFYRRDERYGTWKFYNNEGDLTAQVIYKNGKRAKAIQYKDFLASN